MANITINSDLTIDANSILNKYQDLITDSVMVEIYNLWGKLMEPYVPMDSGNLSHNFEVTPNYIRYRGPYAHYQYIGIVYGPNIPIFQDGELVGFRSPPGKGSKSPKVPQQDIVYNTEKHPLATKEWDKVSWESIKDSFLQGVKDILTRRITQLYG